MDYTSLPGSATPGDDQFAQHYIEVLSLPFRFAQNSEPYATRTISLKDVRDAVESETSGGTTKLWRRVANAAILAEPLSPQPSTGARVVGESSVASDQVRWNRYQHYQAFAYFHPAVRSFLFGAEVIRERANPSNGPVNDFMYWYRRDDVKSLYVCCSGVGMTFDVLRCDLVLMQPDVGILQIELRAQQPCSLRAMQQVRDELRRCYLPYVDHWIDRKSNAAHWRGGHFPCTVILRGDPDPKIKNDAGQVIGGVHLSPTAKDTPDKLTAIIDDVLAPSGLPHDAESYPLAAHWQTLVCGLTNSKKFKFIAPSDDRLPSMAYIAVRAPQSISEGDWVRLTYADAPGNDRLPNSRAFIQSNFNQHVYDRFWYQPGESTDKPSRIMNCGYAFTMVGDAGDRAFFTNELNGAFVAFRQIYVRMGLIAHLQKTALLGAVARLSALAERDGKGEMPRHDVRGERGEAIRRAYEEFLEFTQVYWFDEVSPQEQGVQLFRMWQTALRSQQYYDEVRQELKDQVDFAIARSAADQARSAASLTHVAGVLGVIATIASVLGMNVLPIDNGTIKQGSWLCGQAEACSAALQFWFIVPTLFVVAIAGGIAFWWGKRSVATDCFNGNDRTRR